MSEWRPYPHDADEFERRGDALLQAWPDLHAGDREPSPTPGRLGNILADYPDAAPKDFDGDLEALAARLQEAWRHFHAGRFQSAVETANACGVLGHAPANKSAGVYGTYLEDDDRAQQAVFLAAAKRGELAAAVLPEDPNSHYFHAYNLGRYSQSISIVEALRQGIGGRIHDSLARTLELEPDHAEAHTAMGLYHAEIVDKVGRMIGKMTYGANADEAVEHFERAIELTPESPIALIEFGNGLYLLYGDRELDRITDLYVQASEMTPRDAMERLDVDCALSELE